MIGKRLEWLVDLSARKAAEHLGEYETKKSLISFKIDSKKQRSLCEGSPDQKCF